MNNAKQTIQQGKAILGIEFGSTRIKAVLIDESNTPIAQGSHEWENQLIDGLWTYSLEAIWNGVQDCYADLRRNVNEQYGVEIEHLAAIGVSAMMHGYMAFNDRAEILTPSAHGATPTPDRQRQNSLNCSISTSRSVGASRIYTRRYSTRKNMWAT